MPKPLEKEFRWYLKHQEELLKQYNGKVLTIKNNKILGVFDNELDAINEVSKKEELGTFLVQKCDPGKNSYTQTYHSRVTFAQ